jgi:hypothetical protein
MVSDIQAMGFSREQALAALKATGAASAGVAVNWLFDNPPATVPLASDTKASVPATATSTGASDTAMATATTNGAGSTGSAFDSAALSEFAMAFLQQQTVQYKMVIGVNMKLKMGKGKLAAQVAHGAVSMVRVTLLLNRKRS